MTGCEACERGRQRDPRWPRPGVSATMRSVIRRVVERERAVLERLAQADGAPRRKRRERKTTVDPDQGERWGVV